MIAAKETSLPSHTVHNKRGRQKNINCWVDERSTLRISTICPCHGFWHSWDDFTAVDQMWFLTDCDARQEPLQALGSEGGKEGQLCA